MILLKGFKKLSIASSLAVLASCGGSSPSSEPASPPQAANVEFNGPGSVWDFSLGGDGRFDISRKDSLSSPVDMTVNGDWTRLSTGFLRLSVISITGNDAPNAGDKAWGIEVPGYALFLAPINEQSDQIIPMVTAGACPSANLDANWVLVKKSGSADATDPERDFFGTFTYDATNSTANLPQQRALEGFVSVDGDAQMGGANCESGIMNLSQAGALMYLTDNGGAIVHANINDDDDGSFIFAFPKKAIASVNNLDGQYAGVLYDESLATGSKIAPVSMTCDGGSCVAGTVSDLETGATTGETVELNLTGTPDDLSVGIITGEVKATGAASGGDLACLADVSVGGNSAKMVTCIGQSPSDSSKMFNVIFSSI